MVQGRDEGNDLAPRPFLPGATASNDPREEQQLAALLAFLRAPPQSSRARQPIRRRAVRPTSSSCRRRALQRPACAPGRWPDEHATDRAASRTRKGGPGCRPSAPAARPFRSPRCFFPRRLRPSTEPNPGSGLAPHGTHLGCTPAGERRGQAAAPPGTDSWFRQCKSTGGFAGTLL